MTEEEFFEQLYGANYQQKQRDAQERVRRNAAGKHNLFDDFFGTNAAQEAFFKQKVKFSYKHDPNSFFEDAFGSREGLHPESIKFLEVSFEGHVIANPHDLIQICAKKKRSDVWITRTNEPDGKITIRLEKRVQPKRDIPPDNTIRERVLTKEEVTVTTVVPIDNQ